MTIWISTCTAKTPTTRRLIHRGRTAARRPAWSPARRPPPRSIGSTSIPASVGWTRRTSRPSFRRSSTARAGRAGTISISSSGPSRSPRPVAFGLTMPAHRKACRSILSTSFPAVRGRSIKRCPLSLKPHPAQSPRPQSPPRHSQPSAKQQPDKSRSNQPPHKRCRPFHSRRRLGAVAAGTADQSLPAVSQAASGSVVAPVVGSAIQTLPALDQAVAAEAEIAGEAAQPLPGLSQSASVAVAIAGSASQALPSLTVAAAGQVLILAAPVQTLPAILQAAVGRVDSIVRRQRLEVRVHGDRMELDAGQPRTTLYARPADRIPVELEE